MLAGKDVRRHHIERLDPVKDVENGIRQIETNEVPIRIHFLQFSPEVGDIVLRAASSLPRKVRCAEIIDEQKATPVQVLAEIDDVLWIQVDIAGLGKIGERITE